MWLVADGFDYYNGSGDLAHSVWDSYTGAGGISSNNRFGVGQCFSPNANSQWGLTKVYGSNESTLYVACAFYRPGALSGSSACYYVTFFDAGNSQCTICFESGGNITLKRGDNNGTVVATYAAAFGQDTWNHFQCRVVIDPAVGTFTVRKNGAITDTFAATGLNTRSTANSTANQVGIGGNNIFPFVDDLLIFSGSGAAPNTWVGDCRAICLAAILDTAQKQFAAVGPTPVTFGNTGSNGGFNVVANTLYVSGLWTPTKGGTVTKMSVIGNNVQAGHTQLAIYLNDGAAGGPGTLLGVSAVGTNPGTGTIDFAFTGIAVSQTRSYYFALLADAAWQLQLGNNATLMRSVAQPYTSGFPATAPAVGTGSAFAPWQIVSVAGNALMVSDLLANGDTDYVADATVGDSDLYDLDNLAVTPFAILGVVSRVYIRKSDAGTRQGQLLVKSGATQVAGVDTAVPSTWTYLSRLDVVDPNTSAAWTPAAVNALQVGQKVTL